MKKVTDYEQISSLITKYMKPNMETNCFLTAEDYKNEIARDGLYTGNWPGGLLIFRQRADFFRGNYYITNTDKLPSFEWPETTIMEIVFRPGSSRKILDYWKSLGFEQIFERMRMTRLPQAEGGALDLQIPPVTADEAEDILNESFDYRTACLPERKEIEAEAAEGKFLSRRTETGELAALLRVSSKKAHAEIRQLCVRNQFRGQGLAEQLTEEFSARFGSKKCQVWVRKDYEAPRRIYENNGFTSDGWTSSVIIKNNQAKTSI